MHVRVLQSAQLLLYSAVEEVPPRAARRFGVHSLRCSAHTCKPGVPYRAFALYATAQARAWHPRCLLALDGAGPSQPKTRPAPQPGRIIQPEPAPPTPRGVRAQGGASIFGSARGQPRHRPRPEAAPRRAWRAHQAASLSPISVEMRRLRVSCERRAGSEPAWSASASRGACACALANAGHDLTTPVLPHASHRAPCRRGKTCRVRGSSAPTGNAAPAPAPPSRAPRPHLNFDELCYLLVRGPRRLHLVCQHDVDVLQGLHLLLHHGSLGGRARGP